MLEYDRNEVFKTRDIHTCNFSKYSEHLKQLTTGYVTKIKNGARYFESTTVKTIERSN